MKLIRQVIILPEDIEKPFDLQNCHDCPVVRALKRTLPGIQVFSSWNYITLNRLTTKVGGINKAKTLLAIEEVAEKGKAIMKFGCNALIGESQKIIIIP